MTIDLQITPAPIDYITLQYTQYTVLVKTKICYDKKVKKVCTLKAKLRIVKST